MFRAATVAQVTARKISVPRSGACLLKSSARSDSSIVQRYGIDGDVTGPDDDAFLRHLLECHPEYDLKRGDGIAHFRIIAHTDHGRRSVGLALVRLDGEVADFSWNACLTPSASALRYLPRCGTR